jgi:hypothetical protein
MKPIALIAVVVSLTCLAGSGTAKTRTGVANVWVDSTGGACIRTLPKAYSNARACSSLGAAHAIARRGDVVLVRGGRYPKPQRISRSGPPITIENAYGERPAFTSPRGIAVDAPAANVTLRGLSTGVVSVGANCFGTEAACGARARNIRLVDLNVNSFMIGFVDGLTWLRGDVGPADASAGFQHPWIDSSDGSWAPRNVVIDGAYFHDVTQGTSDMHTECLLITSADNVAVRNSRFKNCYSTGSMYITKINEADDDTRYCRGIMIENNMFLGRDTFTGDQVHFEDDCEITIRNNSFSRDAVPQFLRWQQNAGNGPSQSITVENNYGNGPPSCSLPRHFVFRHNVWLRTRCGAKDVSVSRLDFVNAASDLHLTAKANAIDKGSKTSYSPRDFDGQPRYSGAAPDAGADEIIKPRRSKR